MLPPEPSQPGWPAFPPESGYHPRTRLVQRAMSESMVHLLGLVLTRSLTSVELSAPSQSFFFAFHLAAVAFPFSHILESFLGPFHLFSATPFLVGIQSCLLHLGFLLFSVKSLPLPFPASPLPQCLKRACAAFAPPV